MAINNINEENKLNVLLIAYNRPDKLLKQIHLLEKIADLRIFVACDGPNCAKPNDPLKCEEVKTLLEKWSSQVCEIRLSTSTTNLGLKRRMLTAIDWIANEVDSFIVLEDDCLPDSSFFDFARNGLEAFAQDQSVTAICGFNRYPSQKFGGSNSKCFLSGWHSCWGWATWSNKWRKFRQTSTVAMVLWLLPKALNIKKYKFTIYYFKGVLLSITGIRQSWAYLWSCYNYIHGYSALFSSVNLIANSGMGDDATNTFEIKELPSVGSVRMEACDAERAANDPKYADLAVSNFIKW